VKLSARFRHWLVAGGWPVPGCRGRSGPPWRSPCWIPVWPGPRRRLCLAARCGRGGGLRPGAGEAGEDRLQAFAAEPVVTAVQNSSTASAP